MGKLAAKRAASPICFFSILFLVLVRNKCLRYLEAVPMFFLVV